MTKFIELTTRDTKLTININNIIQFYNLEPNDTGTKMVIFDGVKNREFYVQEKYQDILIALGVGNVLDEQHRNQISNLLNSLPGQYVSKTLDEEKTYKSDEFYSNWPYSD